MKKHLSKIAILLVAAAFFATVAACAPENTVNPANTAGSENIIGPEIPANSENIIGPEIPANSEGGEHHDLTLLSGPILHAAFTNFELSPEVFAGDTVTVRAQYLVVHNEDKSTPCMHFVFVMDAAGCCPVMIRIKYRNNICPDDYPEHLSMVEAHGIFRPFERDGRVIYHYLAAQRLDVVG